jgi:TetR/AcrR family transcriptional regulator, cholesterol catabolism regulator
VQEQAPTRLTRNQEARRQRVISAATELAGEGGYDAVQMRDVAARANVAMGTIYRYFSSKDHLLAAAQVEWAQRLEQRVQSAPRANGTAADRAVAVLRRATRAMERSPKLAAAFVTSMSSADPVAAECQREAAQLVSAAVGSAIDHHEVDDRDGVVEVLGYVWLGALVSWVNGRNTLAQVGDELERAARLLLR